MNVKNGSVMAGMMIACIGCGGALHNVDANQSIEKSTQFLGPRYTQDGNAVSVWDIADKLGPEAEAGPKVKRAVALRVVSTILAAAGGALVGWPVGQWAGRELVGGGDRPNWKLAMVGGGAIAVAIPLGILSDFSMDSGVEAHNKHLEAATWGAAVPVKTTSTQPWKPGERAGAPSKKNAFGFVFGTSKTDAAAACQKAGHEWSEAEGFSRCTGTPSKAIFGASAQLEFAEGGLSSVEVVIAPPNDAGGWASTFKNTESALTGAYGKPSQRSFVVPDDCKTEASFLVCVAEGKVTGSALWHLDGADAATLTIVAMPLPSTSTLRVRIGRPREANM